MLFGGTYNNTGFADVFPFLASFHVRIDSSTANFGFEPQKLKEKFESPEHAGPVDIVSFLEVYDDEEIDMVKRDSFEQVNRLLGLIG
ncbi:hypothetical protein PDUR_01055 [Paenibacillus durus]|uniref:Uncharacterized protein n=1 Tax=Paenibacillus durus TaxID=44251 RepID=A0A089HJA8_PAEDU|nr:hypothetical protein PDUR_01055 [Paenibacillus durus]